MNQSVQILSIEAKDLYRANHYKKENPIGYSIRSASGEISLYKFINTFDYSLDLIKVREIYKKVYRRSDFSFSLEQKNYTQRIINVTFSYNNKEYNKVGKHTYVKFGYDIADLLFDDSLCILNGALIGIKTNTPVANAAPQSILGEYFYMQDSVYHSHNNIPCIHTAAKLRESLYEEGFYCDGIKFVRWKRSSGSSRVGKCLFLDENLYTRIHKWEMCHIKVKENQEIDLAAFEAYISLTLSSLIDTIELSPEEILILDDYTSTFKDDVVVTDIDADGKLQTYEDHVEIHNSIWDGQSLLDKSKFGPYQKYGMLLLRNRFFKSCCFNTNIQDFFADHQIRSTADLNGFTLAKNISDIKLITTKSSIKYYKFGKIETWLKSLSSTFGIVKHEKPTHNFNGRMVQTHYQLFNTLQLSEKEVHQFIQPSLDYVDLLKNDPSALRFHVKYSNHMELEDTPLRSKNDIIYKLLGVNENFTKTKLYYDFKMDVVKAYIKNLRSGRVLVNGTYATLFGNPLEMLYHSIGQFDGTPRMDVGTIHSKNFEYNKTLLGSRSPHVTMGNVWLTRNMEHIKVDTYFNLSKEIVCINAINENILDRLSGCDFDSDTVLLTDNPVLIDAAKRNYHNFKVPSSFVTAKQIQRSYNSIQQSNLDITINKNLIGEIINLSQELNTILWDRIYNGDTISTVSELYYDIAKLDVMSGIEIDKAKKEFVVDNKEELNKIRKKYIIKDESDRIIKPNFFAHIAKLKGYYDSDKKNYQHHHTAMDYLQKIINRYQAKRTNIGTHKNKIEPFLVTVNTSEYNTKKINYKQVDRIIASIDDCNIQIKKIYSQTTLTKEAQYLQSTQIRETCMESIGKLHFTFDTMIHLLILMDLPEYQYLSRLLFYTLFGFPNTSFFQIIRNSSSTIAYLEENTEGTIPIYDLKFSKKCKILS